MKTKLNELKEPLEKEQTGAGTESKESMASECNGCQDKIFSAADLWKIQRRGRTTIQRRN